MSLLKRIEYTGTNFSYIKQMLDAMFKSSGKLSVDIQPHSEKRTLSANAQIYVWYSQIAKQDGESVNTVRNQCKLNFGIPILVKCPKNGRRVQYTLQKVGFYEWSYEQQCNFMDMLAVTSLMTTKQHNEYRDTMQSEYNKNGYGLDYQE